MSRRKPAVRAFTLMVMAGATLAACAQDSTGPDSAPPPTLPVDSLAGMRWSDPATWAPALVPKLNDGVIIPEGRTVVLDVSPPPLTRLLINGTLRVAPDVDVTLSATEVHVKGTLQIGTEARPHLRRFVLTLTGPEVPDHIPTGAKALAVLPGGLLEMHGESRITWTRLSATADAGAMTLQLADNVGRSAGGKVPWRVGDRIVVASTDFDADHADEAEITAVNDASVSISRALSWRHWGTVQQIHGRAVDERAEVGLLTRNIVVQSDSFANTGFGGHLIVLPGGTMRVDGVEFYRMGQRGRLARYAVHWHMLGDATGQYVRNASIWKTNNRCLTIHGTDNTVASHNVCYDHLGHGYFLEDGAESGNRIERNLGLVARVPATNVRLLASDATPATFWLTHPDNHVEGNVAAGSVGFGFWYAFPASPTGLSTGQPDRPRNTPLGVFRDNVAHSNHRPGLQVDAGPKPDGTTETTSYHPRAGAVSNGTPVLAVFENFTAYKHRNRGIWLRGSSQRVVGAVLADNMIGGTFANSTTSIERSFVVGETDNVTAVPSATFPIRGFEFYDGTVGAADVTFANFVSRPGRPASAYGYNRNNGFSTATDNYSRAMALLQSNAVYLDTPAANKDGDKSGVIYDVDGTLTGHAGWVVIPNLAFLRTAECQSQPLWNAFACPHRYLNLRIVSESAEPVAPLTIRRDDGAEVRLVGVPNQPVQASMTVQAQRMFAISQEPAAGARLRLLLQRATPGEWVRVSFPFSGDSVALHRDYSQQRMPAAASVAAVDAGAGESYHWDKGAGRITLKLFVRESRNSTTVQVLRK